MPFETESFVDGLKALVEPGSDAPEDWLHQLMVHYWGLEPSAAFLAKLEALGSALSRFVEGLEGRESPLELRRGLEAMFSPLTADELETMLTGLVIAALEDVSPRVSAGLRAAGIIESSPPAIRVAAIRRLFSEPTAYLAERVGFGDPWAPGTFVDFVDDAAVAAGFEVRRGRIPGRDDLLEGGLVLPVFVDRESGAQVGLSVRRTEDEADPKVALGVFGAGSSRSRLTLGEGWTLEWASDLDGNAEMLFDPSGLGLGDGHASAELRIALRGTGTSGQTDRQGDGARADGTLLHVEGPFLEAGLRADGADTGWSVRAGVTRASVPLSRLFEGQDGFLTKVVRPPENARASASLALTMDDVHGVTVEGGAGLDVDVPLDLELGPVRFTRLGLHAGLAETLDADVDVDVELDLGPLHASVSGIGLQLELPLDAQALDLLRMERRLSMKPPNGAGLSLDAGPVHGGGMLRFYADEGRYQGTFSLEAGKLDLDALALIDTRLPGRDDGFALLAFLALEFDPGIALGYGFFLKGVGGMLGLNRTLDTDAVLAAVRDGSLGSVMFPENPVENATTVLDDLDRLFPVDEGRFLVAPMAVITWSNPPIVRAEVAVVLVLPEPVQVALLGQLSCVLPDQDNPIVRLQVDVAGVLDLGRKLLAVDASLRDSKVLEFPIYGDMALRLGWGDDPQFTLAVGGLHPAVARPEGLPTLRRVGMDIGFNDNPRLSVQGYLALTSNTAQFGARIEAWAKKGGASLSGVLSLDALFQFSPFEFRVNVQAAMEVKWRGHSLLGVGLSLAFSGPTPYEVDGVATAEILCFDVEVPVRATFGPRKRLEPPAYDPTDQLLATLKGPGAWTSAEGQGARLVQLRDIGALENGAVILAPDDELRISQSVLPLAVPVTMFGNAPLPAPLTFDVKLRPATGRIRERALVDRFAPASFQKMSRDARLSAAAYGTFKSGVAVRIEGLGVWEDGSGEAASSSVEVTFQNRVLGETRRTTPRPGTGVGPTLPAAIARAYRPRREVHAVLGRSSRFHSGETPLVELSEVHYVVVEAGPAGTSVVRAEDEHLSYAAAGAVKAALRRQASKPDTSVTIVEESLLDKVA